MSVPKACWMVCLSLRFCFEAVRFRFRFQFRSQFRAFSFGLIVSRFQFFVSVSLSPLLVVAAPVSFLSRELSAGWATGPCSPLAAAAQQTYADAQDSVGTDVVALRGLDADGAQVLCLKGAQLDARLAIVKRCGTRAARVRACGQRHRGLGRGGGQRWSAGGGAGGERGEGESESTALPSW